MKTLIAKLGVPVMAALMAANAHATTVAMTCTSGTFAAENSGSFDAYLGTMNNQMINGNDLIGIYAFQINSINPNNLTISSPFYATCLSPQGVLYTGTPYTYTVESYVTASPGLDPGSWVSPGKAPYAGILNANYLFQTLSGSIISSQNADQGAAMALAMYTALYNSTGYGTVADGADLSAPNGQAQFVIPGLTGSVLSYYENDLGDLKGFTPNSFTGAYVLRAPAGAQDMTLLGTGLPTNYQPVPEPTTLIAGALLLLPFGASTLRILRRNRTA